MSDTQSIQPLTKEILNLQRTISELSNRLSFIDENLLETLQQNNEKIEREINSVAARVNYQGTKLEIQEGKLKEPSEEYREALERRRSLAQQGIPSPEPHYQNRDSIHGRISTGSINRNSVGSQQLNINRNSFDTNQRKSVGNVSFGRPSLDSNTYTGRLSKGSTYSENRENEFNGSNQLNEEDNTAHPKFSVW